MKSLKGKTAFITGGGSGIGLGMAEALAAQGANLMLADLDTDALADAKTTIRAFKVDVDTVQVDVASRDDMARAAEETISRFGKVHVLCNNAGVGHSGTIGEIDPGDWDWLLDVNLFGVINTTEAFLPHLTNHGEDRHIVNTASMAGLVASAKTEVYTATKYAVVALSECWHAELKEKGIGVSVLCPGLTRSRIDTSRRSRDPRYGDDPSPDRPLVEGVDFAALLASGTPAEAVGNLVVESILADRLYILPHTEYEDALNNRFTEMLAAFDRAKASKILPGRTTFGLPQSMASDPLASQTT